jgi:hypothetical protein
MNKKLIATIVSMALLCGSLPALAGAYIGAGAGYFRINNQDFLDEDNDLRDDRGAWKAFAGVNINDIFGLEVSQVDFGKSEDGLLELEADGHTFAATLGAPVGDNGSVYLKAGKLFWDVNANIGDVISASDDGEDEFYGIGMRFGMAPGLGIKVEYEEYELDDTEIDMPSISLNLAF